MKAAVYYNNNDVRIEEKPKPKISSKEILVKMHACGICGSDVLEWYRLKTAPRVLGHEMTGEVVEVGDEVASYKVGDRVFVSHHVACNECYYCKNGNHTACDLLRKTNYDPGGFAEYIRVPSINIEKNGVYLLPEDISYEEGVFIEPLGCVVRAQRLAEINKDDTVLVLGSGGSGLLHIKLAKSKGAKVIATDIEEHRLEFAKKFGADEVVNARENVAEFVMQVNDDRLADKVIVCAGALEAVNQAAIVVERGGTIMFFALPKPEEKIVLPLTSFWKDEITMKTSYGAADVDIKEAITLLKKLNVAELISHKLPLDKAQEGFKLVAEAKDSIKVILTQ